MTCVLRIKETLLHVLIELIKKVPLTTPAKNTSAGSLVMSYGTCEEYSNDVERNNDTLITNLIKFSLYKLYYPSYYVNSHFEL